MITAIAQVALLVIPGGWFWQHGKVLSGHLLVAVFGNMLESFSMCSQVAISHVLPDISKPSNRNTSILQSNLLNGSPIGLFIQVLVSLITLVSQCFVLP